MQWIVIAVSLLFAFAVLETRTHNPCTCENDQNNNSDILQGPPGKRGPPGDVIQCGCNTSEVLGDLRKLRTEVESFNENDGRNTLARSCKDIIERNQSRSSIQNGIYKLQDSFGDEYSTYCDMEIDGGGWTLIASVHDNNPFESGRCTVGDRWSSEQGNTSKLPKGDGNWENLNTFGQVKTATFDDFKCPGYFEIQARDIMIWQIPNNTPLRNFSRLAYLKYRTNNGFLTQYGGNLQRLYSEHFPIISRAYQFPADRGPSIPVVFDKGSGVSLMQHLAPNLINEGLEVGYIQFRPISTHRDAFAICPGFRMTSQGRYPGHGCLGSTAYNNHVWYCGDTTSYHEATPTYKTGWTADELLVKTTYMIFYR